MVGLGVISASAHAVEIGDPSSPLTSIGVTPDLNCAVNHAGDSAPAFFGTTACGTLVASGGTLYGPASIPAGGSASPRTTFGLISQSAATGDGSVGSPRSVTTTVTGGDLTLVETDSYIFGQEAYRTDVTLTNSGATSAEAIIYRAGDCFLEDSDFGFGLLGPAAGAVACKSATSERIEQWLPITSGSHFMEDFFASVWGHIGSQQPFQDTCTCATNLDNGAGLSWSVTLAVGASVTVSHLTNFSPTGTQPVDTTKTADDATVVAGASDGYTITLHNSNAEPATLLAITDTLPAGFSYQAASTTGVTTADPSVSGQTLRWTGPFVIAAGGDVVLHFGVTAASAPGTYYNEAGGETEVLAVTPTGPTAPVTVTSRSTSTDYTGAGSVQYSDAAALSGTLEDTSTTPTSGVPGKTLGFELGTQTTSGGPTDANGDAGASLVVTQQPGSVSSVTASFAGDADYAASSDTAPFTIAKEDCTLSYSGDTLVPATSSTTLAADMGELDSSLGDRSGKTVTFTVTDAASNVQTFAATTNAAGHAESVQPLGSNVYGVMVSFAGDDYYESCATATDTLVTVQAAGSKVTGGGWIAVGTGRTSFGFNAIPEAGGLFKGQIQLRSNNGKNRFHGNVVLGLSGSGNAATWNGTGKWNGTPGYKYTVSVVDNGSSGSKKGDTISITIKTPGNVTVYSTSGSQVLKGGNITVH